MKYVKLGKTGLSVSKICLGCMSYGTKKWREWVLTEDQAREHFARAIENGINFYDTANVYSLGVSEQITGRWLGEMGRRDELVIATKVHGRMAQGPNCVGLSRKHIVAACEASLRRLKTDYIDLYQIHRWDYTTPIEETLEGLDSLVRAGKVRYLGASSMAAWQFSKALYTAGENGWHRFVSMQNHYNLVYREEEREMIPLCVDRGVGVIPWSPLARGFLCGNRTREGKALTTRASNDAFASPHYTEDGYEIVEAVAKVASARGVTPGEVAPGVDAAGAGRHRADNRHDQTESSRGGDQSARPGLDARGDRGARGAVPAQTDRGTSTARRGGHAQIPSRKLKMSGWKESQVQLCGMLGGLLGFGFIA